MARIGIVTDSTAGLPADVVERYGIGVAPLSVNFGKESFRENVDLTYEQFLDRLAHTKALPTTSQPPPEEFSTVFRKLADDHDSIISVDLSVNLPSGTVNSARLAAQALEIENPNLKITVIDSLSAWMGTGLMAIAAAKAAERGLSHDEIVKMVEAMTHKMKVLLVVDSLDHLQRGGRIGGAQAMLGNLLQIKPILTVHDGRVEPLERVRTRRKAIDRMVELVAEHVGDKPYTMALGYVGSPDDARGLGEQIRARKPQVRDSYLSPVTPVVATHTGPGTIGLIYYVHGEND